MQCIASDISPAIKSHPKFEQSSHGHTQPTFTDTQSKQLHPFQARMGRSQSHAMCTSAPIESLCFLFPSKHILCYICICLCQNFVSSFPFQTRTEYALRYQHLHLCCHSAFSCDDGCSPEDGQRTKHRKTSHKVEDAAPAVIHGNKTNQGAFQTGAKASKT